MSTITRRTLFSLAAGLALGVPVMAYAAPTPTPDRPSPDPARPRDRATADQPDTRFDTAWIILPEAEAGSEFTIQTDYGFSQKYTSRPYAVIPPPAGGWVPGKSYPVHVRYASGRSSTVEVRLPDDAADPGLRGALSGPDASGALTVQLTGVTVGEEIGVSVYTSDMSEQAAHAGGRAASTSPRYRLVPANGWREGQTYVVMVMVGSRQPTGDYRWVQSFTYRKPAQPATKDRSGGLSTTGR